MLKAFLTAFLGPRLYKVSDGPKTLEPYDSNPAEYYGDSMIGVLTTSISFTRSAWFLVLPYMYTRHYFTREGAMYLLTLSQVLGLVLVASFIARGVGRITNPSYMLFLQHYLAEVEDHKTKKAMLAAYSYDFSWWSVDFDVDALPNDVKKDFKQTFNLKPLTADKSLPLRVLLLPYDLLCRGVMHIVGRRMIYPGSMQILNSLVREPCENARATIFKNHGESAERYKLRTSHGHFVDCLVVDKRPATRPPSSSSDLDANLTSTGSPPSSSTSASAVNGRKLVICCEGNGGFYEIGILATPLTAGYSVLGWNHPGFGGSTGLPWPEYDTAAVDTAYKFARTQLGFADEDIIIFAWSIGGFTASWLAMNYPNVHALVIDASFDDLIPLAIAKMPNFLEGTIVRSIRAHMDLRVADQVSLYNGPVQLYRRTRDEIITTNGPRDIGSNRGNDLALQLLRHRYPQVFDDEVAEYIKRNVLTKRLSDLNIENEEELSDEIGRLRDQEMTRDGASFPSALGSGDDLEKRKRVAMFLVEKYVIDLEDQHCTPLPPAFFVLPDLV